MCTPTASASKAPMQACMPLSETKYEGLAWIELAQGSIETYEYRIQVVGDKLQVWLRDCKADQEWQSDMKDLSTIVEQPNLSIPGATIADYAKYFSHCLASKPTADGEEEAGWEAGWELCLPSEGTRRLEFFVPIQVCGTKLLNMYEIDLLPIEKECNLDVVAKVKKQESEIAFLRDECRRLETELGKHRDQAEDDMGTLKDRVDDLQLEVRDLDEMAWGEGERSYVIGSSEPDFSDGLVNWKVEHGILVAMSWNAATRQIHLDQTGLYMVQVVKTSRYQPNMELWVGETEIRFLSCSDDPTTQLVHAKQGETISVRVPPYGPMNFQPQLHITVVKL